MPTTNNASQNVTHIDGAERPIEPSLLDFLREQTRAAIIERREKLGSGTGGLQEREELAVLYAQALTLGLDHVTLSELSIDSYVDLPHAEWLSIERALANVASLVRWANNEAGLA